MNWLREHSLSITVLVIWAGLLAASFLLHNDTAASWLAERAGGHADDAFGALLIIIGTKWLLERGKHPSAQSK